MESSTTREGNSQQLNTTTSATVASSAPIGAEQSEVHSAAEEGLSSAGAVLQNVGLHLLNEPPLQTGSSTADTETHQQKKGAALPPPAPPSQSAMHSEPLTQPIPAAPSADPVEPNPVEVPGAPLVPVTNTNSAALAVAGIDASSGTLTVIDPLSRKIDIPLSDILPTKALNRDPATMPLLPSLCMLFMENRCRQGNECNQIHADPTVVFAIRQASAKLPTCCHYHGDVNQQLFEAFPSWQGSNLLIEGVMIPIDFVAFTKGLQRSMTGAQNHFRNTGAAEQMPVSVSATFVCRLQAGGLCRYSEECKFVHLCREVSAQHLSHCVFPLVTTDNSQRNKRSLQQQMQMHPSQVKLGIPTSAQQQHYHPTAQPNMSSRSQQQQSLALATRRQQLQQLQQIQVVDATQQQARPRPVVQPFTGGGQLHQQDQRQQQGHQQHQAPPPPPGYATATAAAPLGIPQQQQQQQQQQPFRPQAIQVIPAPTAGAPAPDHAPRQQQQAHALLPAFGSSGEQPHHPQSLLPTAFTTSRDQQHPHQISANDRNSGQTIVVTSQQAPAQPPQPPAGSSRHHQPQRIQLVSQGGQSVGAQQPQQANYGIPLQNPQQQHTLQHPSQNQQPQQQIFVVPQDTEFGSSGGRNSNIPFSSSASPAFGMSPNGTLFGTPFGMSAGASPFGLSGGSQLGTSAPTGGAPHQLGSSAPQFGSGTPHFASSAPQQEQQHQLGSSGPQALYMMQPQQARPHR